MKRSTGAFSNDHRLVLAYLTVDSRGRATPVYMCVAGAPPQICRVHSGPVAGDTKGGGR